MKKLKLDLANLRVESFTAESESGNGTVVGHSEESFHPFTHCQISCVYGATCGAGPGYCDPYSGWCGSGLDGC